MDALSRIWHSLIAPGYRYEDSLELNQAQGIMKMSVGSVIGIWLGLLFLFTDTPSAEDALIVLAGIPLNNLMVAYLIICLLSLIQWQVVTGLVRQGEISSAAGIYVAFLFLAAVLAYIPAPMTNATALALSLPITAGAVLLSRAGFARIVFIVIAFLYVLYVLNEIGLMDEISTSGISELDVLIYGSIILGVNAIILNVFLGGRNLIYQRILAVTSELEGVLENERTQKAQLEEAMRDYNEFARSVADGNLTVRLDLATANNAMHSDVQQHGNSLNSMVESLTAITRQVQDTASLLNETSVELLTTVSQQVSSVTEQDAAITETMATLEEINMTVSQTADRAQGVATISQNTVDVSRHGQEAVADTIASMERIQNRVQDIAETIVVLSERTQQVGEIIESVNAIADQSKLLALNASIEAARAGESGSGFNVVAMEVRQLAEQSREATKRVQGILGEIQDVTNTAVMVTEEGIKGASEGVTIVAAAGDAITALVAAIEESVQAASQIAASTQQQSSGMGQLMQAMQQIRQASAQAAEGTQQVEKSAKVLADMAGNLGDTVARYRVT